MSSTPVGDPKRPSNPLPSPERAVPLTPQGQESPAVKDAFTARASQKPSSAERASSPLESLRSFLERVSRQGGEGLFEKALRRLAEQGLKLIPSLEGKKAAFASKTTQEWVAFFANLKKRGHQDREFEIETETLEAILFRGLMEEGEGKKVLVSDLRLSQKGSPKEEKFVRVSLENKGEDLEKMAPGDELPCEFFTGSRLRYRRHIPIFQGLEEGERTSWGGRNMAHFKNEYNAKAQRKIEERLLGVRLEEEPSLAAFPEIRSSLGEKKSPFWLWLVVVCMLLGGLGWALTR